MSARARSARVGGGGGAAAAPRRAAGATRRAGAAPRRRSAAGGTTPRAEGGRVAESCIAAVAVGRASPGASLGARVRCCSEPRPEACAVQRPGSANRSRFSAGDNKRTRGKWGVWAVCGANSAARAGISLAARGAAPRRRRQPSSSRPSWGQPSHLQPSTRVRTSPSSSPQPRPWPADHQGRAGGSVSWPFGRDVFFRPTDPSERALILRRAPPRRGRTAWSSARRARPCRPPPWPRGRGAPRPRPRPRARPSRCPRSSPRPCAPRLWRHRRSRARRPWSRPRRPVVMGFRVKV